MKFTNNLYKITCHIILASFISVTLISCGGGGGGGGDAEEPTTTTQQPDIEQRLSDLSVGVNPILLTAVETIPAIDTSGIERSVAVIRDELGNEYKFVENELIIMTNDSDVLEGFIKRWNGELIKTVDIQSLGLTGGVDVHMVRVNTDAADVSRLRDDMLTLGGDIRGATEVSSDTAHRLLAAGAREAVNGFQVGINWVGSGDDISSRATRDGNSAPGNSTAFTTNAFDWSFMNAGSEQDIGVTEAWYLLDQQDKLRKTVGLAILDMGFVPDENGDIDPSYIAISNIPFVSATGTANLGCSGGNPCPWHGTKVANAAMGILDNRIGGAGPAGHVARPILVSTLPDILSSFIAVAEAMTAGADIINMSYGIPIPGILSWAAEPFQHLTSISTLAGKLFFASAGNSNSDVDGESCFGPFCWENTLVFPCESRGVICVGGLERNSKSRSISPSGDSGSSYGSKGSVQIFAPYRVLVGGGRDESPNVSYYGSGTSYSSPYTAGVAALIWAANPSLSGQQVRDIMMRTAHTSPDSTVPRYVNAQAAVGEALGTSVTISSPEDGDSFAGGTSIMFSANAFSNDRGTATLEWSSNIDVGLRSTEQTFFNRNLSPGTHVIKVTAVFSDGFRQSDTVTIEIVNSAPTVGITQPAPADIKRYFLNESIVLKGDSVDSNNPANSFDLYDDQVSWYIDGVFKGTGHEISVEASDLGIGGPYTVEFVGDDGFATPVTSQILVYVDPDDLGNQRPEARITSPATGSIFVADMVDASGSYKTVSLTWTATDEEDGVLPFSSTNWSVKVNGGVSQPLDVTEHVLTIPNPGGFAIVLKTYSIKLYASDSFSREYEITLTVKDSGNGDIGAVKTSLPDKVTVRIDNLS